MKINNLKLLESIVNFQKFSSNIVPVLQCVKINADKENECVLSSTNGDITYKEVFLSNENASVLDFDNDTAEQIFEAFSFLVDINNLTEFVKFANKNRLIIYITNSGIFAGEHKCEINTADILHFPADRHEIVEEVINIKSDNIKLFSGYVSDSRPDILDVCVNNSGMGATNNAWAIYSPEGKNCHSQYNIPVSVATSIPAGVNLKLIKCFFGYNSQNEKITGVKIEWNNKSILCYDKSPLLKFPQITHKISLTAPEVIFTDFNEFRKFVISLPLSKDNDNLFMDFKDGLVTVELKKQGKLSTLSDYSSKFDVKCNYTGLLIISLFAVQTLLKHFQQVKMRMTNNENPVLFYNTDCYLVIMPKLLKKVAGEV